MTVIVATGKRAHHPACYYIIRIKSQEASVSIHLLDKTLVLNRKILRNKLCRLYIPNIDTNYEKISQGSPKQNNITIYRIDNRQP